MQNVTRDAARDIAQRTDVRELLRRLVPAWESIERHSAATLHGPCPKCGGVDRFYANATGCACNKCHTQRMDAVGLVAWLHDVPMAEAVQLLDAQALRSVTTVTANSSTVTTVTTVTNDSSSVTTVTQPENWQPKALRLLLRAETALYTESGAAGRQYLLSRGLQPDTWRAFSLGYDAGRSLPKDRGQTHGAITWPVLHESTGVVVAVRYRYAGATVTSDRYDSLSGSRTVGRLFGVQCLPEFTRYAPDAGRVNAEALRCLVVCEGEFNAMSVWQACHATNVDVLSFGAESQRTLPAWAVDVAQRYGAVVAWVDDAAKAQDVAKQLPQAVALRSPIEDGTKQDANACLVRGVLGGLVQTARLSCLRRPAQRESVLWDIWDAKDAIDAGQRHVAQRLAQALGKAWTA